MGDSRKAFSLDIRGTNLGVEESTVRQVSKMAMTLVSKPLEDGVRASSRASQSENGTTGVSRV